jgi:CHASE3 domain sensor protein
MREALESLYAIRLMAEFKQDHAAVEQLNSDIRRLESDIRQYLVWGNH